MSINIKYTSFYIALWLSLFVANNTYADANNSEILKESPSEQLKLILQRGTLIVGVKGDYPPWGFYSEGGELTGLETDLAKDIAARLGVRLQLQAVTTSNRIGKLESGAIDLLIATMGDTEQRRQQTGIIEPSYYSSGASIITHQSSKIKSWAELYGQTVCLSRNTYFNRDLIERFLLKPKIFQSNRDNLSALNTGLCSAWAYDDTALANLLQQEQWADFKTPLDTIIVNPWAIAIKSTEKRSDYAHLISTAVIDWHRTGTLLELEKKWGIRNSQFIKQQHERWSKKNDQGEYACQPLDDHSIPSHCLSHRSISLTSTNQSGILSEWGIDFPPLYDDYSLNSLLKGIGLTLLLSASAIIGSISFGILIGLSLYKLPRPASWIAGRINDMFRMTPPLLNLYIVFFGLGGLLALHYGVQLNAICIAIIVFSLYAGSSNAVVLLHALEQESITQKVGAIKHILPAALQHAYEGINANSINIVKAVGLASMISVPELISSSNSIIAEYGSASEMMTFLLIFYFFIVYLFIFLLKHTQQFILNLSLKHHE